MSRKHMVRCRVVSVEAKRLVPAVLHELMLSCGHSVERLVIGRHGAYKPEEVWCGECASRSHRTRPEAAKSHVITWPPIADARKSPEWKPTVKTWGM